MAIASMQKVMIVAHRSQASELLVALQDAGIVQVLDAERAMVSKEWPELMVEVKRHREEEELLERLRKSIDFLNPYSPKDKTSLFAPLVEINKVKFDEAVEENPIAILGQVEGLSTGMDKIKTETETQKALLERLMIWRPLRIPVEEFASLKSSSVFIGLVPDQHVAELKEKLLALGAAFDTVARSTRSEAAVIAALHENASDVQKLLRAYEFEPAVFEGMRGTIDDNISLIHKKLDELQVRQDELKNKVYELAKHKLNLQILFDYHQNFHGRIQAESSAPATDHAIFFEGWVKWKDFDKLKRIISQFDACDVSTIKPAEDEEPPVEIENAKAVRPFELITRLYGMPHPTSLDPTVFMAPFFAIFFGLCLNDAAYGLVLMAILAWVLKKSHANKGAYWMLLVCGFFTFLAGVITGSWFGDAITSLLAEGSWLRNVLDTMRVKLMLFDPMVQPMTFFGLSLGLGYLQIQVGLFIAFFANITKKDFAAAIFDQLAWIIHLNSLVCVGLSAGGILAPELKKPFLIIALFTSASILLFSARSGGWGGRIGMGVFQLFSTVFYMGDVLSYVRLMALGMVGSGFGLAINVLVKLVSETPYIGWLLGLLLFVGGHLFNLAMSMLGAFVHSMRLQFVEFFPKFFTGGGRDFEPLQNKYNYVEVRE